MATANHDRVRVDTKPKVHGNWPAVHHNRCVTLVHGYEGEAPQSGGIRQCTSWFNSLGSCICSAFSLFTATGSARTVAGTARQMTRAMTKSSFSARLLLTLSAGPDAKCLSAVAQADTPVSSRRHAALPAPGAPTLVAIRKDASELESFAANEVRRYIYLRAGRLLPVKRGLSAGGGIAVSCNDAKFCWPATAPTINQTMTVW